MYVVGTIETIVNHVISFSYDVTLKKMKFIEKTITID